MTTTFLDLRKENTPSRPRFKMNGRFVIVRPASGITSVVIHQTACVFGPAANPEKRHRRALNVACHALAFNDGTVALPAELRWHANGGNGFNPYALHLEVEGMFPGRPDEPSTPKREDLASTWNNEPTPLTKLGLQTAKDALLRLVNEGRALGMPLRFIYAHRQSSASRRSDPGFELWRDLVLGYAVPVLGLRTMPDLVVGDGRAIPKQWDPSAKASY